MSKVSFEDIGAVIATFAAQDGVKPGQMVKITANKLKINTTWLACKRRLTLIAPKIKPKFKTTDKAARAPALPNKRINADKASHSKKTRMVSRLRPFRLALYP